MEKNNPIDDDLLIFTGKISMQKEEKENPGFIEDYFLMLPIETFQVFLRAPNPAEVCGLYVFYCYTAKWQDTNQPKATDGFVRKGLNIGRTRLAEAQKFLIENGFIEKINKRDMSGIITGWYIKVKYRFQNNLYSKKINETALLETMIDPIGMGNQFKMLKEKGLDEKIYERDNYICVYCQSKVESIDILRKKGLNNKDIAKYVSENTSKIATIDHIIPLSAGGDNSEANLTTACLHCNCKKKDNHINGNEQVDKKPLQRLSTSGQTTTNALLDININALNDINKVESPVFLDLAKHLKDLILKNNPEAKVTDAQVKHWSNDVRLMIERDNRTAEKIKVLLNWTQSNEFWKTNILSMGTFRDKFDRLTLQMNRKSGNLLNRERGLEYKVKKAASNV